MNADVLTRRRWRGFPVSLIRRIQSSAGEGRTVATNVMVPQAVKAGPGTVPMFALTALTFKQ